MEGEQEEIYRLLKIYKCYDNDLYSVYFFDKRIELTKQELLSKLKKNLINI